MHFSINCLLKEGALTGVCAPAAAQQRKKVRGLEGEEDRVVGQGEQNLWPQEKLQFFPTEVICDAHLYL